MTKLPIYAVVIPALVGALWLSANGIVRALGPSGSAPDGSLADAIRDGGPEQVYALLHAGVDPNAPIVFSHPDLTNDQDVLVSPMVLAVARNNDNDVRTLMSFGARLDLPRNRKAICLARRLGHDDVAAMIIRDARIDGEVRCPAPVNAKYPLLDFAESR